MPLRWMQLWRGLGCWLLVGSHTFSRKYIIFAPDDNAGNESLYPRVVCYRASKLALMEERSSFFLSANACNTHAPCFQTLSIEGRWRATLTWKLVIFQANYLVVWRDCFLISKCNLFLSNWTGQLKRVEYASSNFVQIKRGNYFCVILSVMKPFPYTPQMPRVALWPW